MTRITYLCLVVLVFVYTNSMATTLSLINNNGTNYAYSNIQRVRIDFKMPDGFTRHLLLAFTKDNSAGDGYDYGYDALNKDAYPYDLNWLVDNKRCVIQGVGAFDNSKKYPFWMFMSQDGDIEISLDTLENFDAPIDIFIYDALLSTYTRINDSNFATKMSSGEYTDRFYIAFKDESVNSSQSVARTTSLDIEDYNLQNTRVSYLSNSREVYVNTNDEATIRSINVYNILGQKIASKNHMDTKEIKIPIQSMTKMYGIVIIETDIGVLNKKLLLN